MSYGFAMKAQTVSRALQSKAWLVALSAVLALPGMCEGASPEVTDVEAAGTGVQVTFYRGAPAPAGGSLDVVITSSLCGEVGRVSAATNSEIVVATVPNALSAVLACGPQHFAILEDVGGPVGGSLAFRVDLSCNGANVCHYVLEPGLEIAGALVASSDLTQALNQGAGNGDLVSSVIGAQPQLRDEMMSYALHLDRLISLQGGGWSTGCRCFWVGSLERSGLLAGYDTFYLWADEDTTAADEDGSLRLDQEVRCYLPTGAQVLSAVLPGQTVLTIPAFDRCAGPTPVPRDVFVDLEVMAKAGGTPGHAARSEAIVELFSDGELESSGLWTATREEVSGEPEAASFEILTFGPEPSASFEIQVNGEVSVSVNPRRPPLPPDLGACLAGGLTLRSASLTDEVIIFRLRQDRDYPEGEDPVACREVVSGSGGTVLD